jgi:hypothetical protein
VFGFLGRIWEWISAWPAVVLPVFTTTGESRRLRPWLRWTLHFLLLSVVLVALGFANYYFDLEVILQSPWPLLRKIWLPLVFLLLYGLAWSGWWLWLQLRPEPVSSAFPDIDAAWREARQALDREGIDPTEVPLFLVLGEPEGGSESLFTASRIPFRVRHVPLGTDAPLRVYASAQGIFVTCRGASLLGRQASLFAEDRPSLSPDAAPEPEEEEEPVAAAAAGHKVRMSGVRPSVVLKARAQRRSSLQEAAERDSKGSVPPPNPGLAAPDGRASLPLLKSTEEIDLHTNRLAYLCSLLWRERRPYCPLNGILVLLPWAALADDTLTQHAGRLCLRDLAAVQELLQVQCPVFVLVCDVESDPGFREVARRLPEQQRRFRLGVGFPLAPDLEAEQLPQMVNDGVRWMTGTQFPTLIYNLLSPNTADHDDPQALDGNIRLYQFLYRIRECRDRLTRLLNRSIFRPTLPLGGCFFAGSGPGIGVEPAFVAGVFPLLIQHQNAVAWTPQPLLEEAAYHRWTLLGYVGLAVVSISLIAAAYFL